MGLCPFWPHLLVNCERVCGKAHKTLRLAGRAKQKHNKAVRVLIQMSGHIGSKQWLGGETAHFRLEPRLPTSVNTVGVGSDQAATF